MNTPKPNTPKPPQKHPGNGGPTGDDKKYLLVRVVCCAGPLLLFGLFSADLISSAARSVSAGFFLAIGGIFLLGIALGYYVERMWPKVSPSQESRNAIPPEHSPEHQDRKAG